MIKIFSDSTCDLSPELVKRYDITILPLHVLLGDEDYLDGVSIVPEEIYAWADEHKTTPKTAAPSLEDTMNSMKKVLDDGHEIVVFSISCSMSSSNNIMRMAAEELGAEDKVTVIDSANLSTGIGLQVIEAAEMAAAGKSRAEIEAEILRIRDLVRASFVVDTLTYLYRGGRCNAVAAMAGSVLKLHPRISVEKGAMGAGKKYRGNLAPAVMNYVKDMEEDLKKAKTDRVFITHSGCNPEIVEQVRSYLADLNHFTEILETRAGGVVSSHCGPGTLGVLFIAGE